MIGSAGHVPDHHVGHGRDLAVFGLLDEDGDAAGDEFAIKLDALRTSYELAIAVVSCGETREEAKMAQLDLTVEAPPPRSHSTCSVFRAPRVHYVI